MTEEKPMTNQFQSDPKITSLKYSELENLIEKLIDRKMKQEKFCDHQPTPERLLETFGGWEDTKTDQEIIDEIYLSRKSDS